MPHPHNLACPGAPRAGFFTLVARPAAVVIALVTAAAVACQKAETPAAKTKEAEPADKAQPVEKASSAATPSDPDCIGAWTTDGEPETMKVGDVAFERRGAHLKQTTSDDDAKAILGVMANIKEDTPDNLANIKDILSFFEAEGVEAIVVAGDLGETEAQISNVLGPIAETGLPVFIIIGNREPKDDFNRAAKSVAEDHPGVVNMNFVRLASLDDVALLSVPGYYDRSYIHAKNGCHYESSDLAIVGEAMKAAGDKPVVLVSHGPPKQEGPDALDRTLEQANVGDPALSEAMTEAGVKFGIFANIQEAGGKATNPSGKRVVGAGDAAEAMYLNPGATDSVSWQMNDGTRSVGMATVMTIDSGKASYKVHRIPEKG